jgi:hypothetical protein
MMFLFCHPLMMFWFTYGSIIPTFQTCAGTARGYNERHSNKDESYDGKAVATLSSLFRWMQSVRMYSAEVTAIVFHM